MVKNITLYIGSNNKTHKLEYDRICKIVSGQHDGFTIHRAVGYWLGSKENTAVVNISDDEAKILNTCKHLKKALKQDAIALQVTPALAFI